MKQKTGILLIVFFCVFDAQCRKNTTLLSFFPEIEKIDTVFETEVLLREWFRSDREIDTLIALKHFFNNDIDEMHDVDVGYNPDDNEYMYTPYTKKVVPIFKIKRDLLYLLCYAIRPEMYLSIYDSKTDTIVSSCIIIINDPDRGGYMTWSTLFPNGYILTIQSEEKGFYILTKIDYVLRKFIEIKKIEFIQNKSDDKVEKEAFEALGISKKGILLESNK
jgi:hypothetical protein